MNTLFDPPYTYRIIVHRVVDADTVEATIDLGFGVLLKNRKVRLAGINAPEMNTEAGVEARIQLLQMIQDYGQRPDLSDDVRLLIVTKLDRNDKYGRILGRLRGFDRTQEWMPVDINQKLVQGGFAEAVK